MSCIIKVTNDDIADIKYIIYDVTKDELEILKREGFEFVKDPPYFGSKTWNVMFECDKPYFDMALHAIRRA